MNKLQITFTFGCDYQGDGKPLLLHEQCEGIDEICNRATDLFGGYTKVNTVGDRRDPDTGKVFTETGATIMVLTDLPPARVSEQILAMVNQIKKSLKQKAVAVIKQTVESEII